MAQGDDTNSNASDDERRLAVRENVVRRGKVAFGAAVHDVVVLDVSEGGVRARSAIPLSLPETFVLDIGADMAFTAHLRWCQGTVFGAALIAPRVVSNHTSRRLLAPLEFMRARNFAEAYARLRECNFQGDPALRALLDRAETANAELEAALRRRVFRG
jgi:hypothetical protein